MRLALNELLKKLSVEHVMVAYETSPWMFYDEDRGITCSAEVRMGTEAEDCEAEVQFLYDDPEQAQAEAERVKAILEKNNKSEKKDPQKKKDDYFDYEEDLEPPHEAEIDLGTVMIQQKFYMHARLMGQGMWSPSLVIIQGHNFTNQIGEWEEKACTIFKLCVQAIKMSEIPDIEDLIKKEMDEGWGGGGRRGKIGRKSPTVKPGQLLGMKKPM